jgi:hypothetical protein
LQAWQVIAIVPASLSPLDDVQTRLDALPALHRWVRRMLLLMAGGWLLVFGVALWLNPYQANGQPRQMETHLQLGLPPCTFRVLTGVPCPSCGMTTSFALLARGDIVNSMRANAVGTLLAAFGMVLVPWSLASVYKGRLLIIRSLETALTWTVVVFVTLMLIRWAVVLIIGWQNGSFH